jgi:iron complex transport system permease protein
VRTTRPDTNASEQTPCSASGTRAPTVPETSEEVAHGHLPPGLRHWRRAAVVLPVLLVGLCGAVLFATAFGSVHIGTGEVLKLLLNHTGLFHFRPTWDQTDEIIILQLRLPHVVGAALVGMALAVAGVLFQGLLRNPLADPFLIGTSAGASLGITVAFLLPTTVFALGFEQIAAFAFFGALAAVALVYWLARVGGRTSVISLLLAGVVITTLMSAIQTLVVDLDTELQLRFRSVFAWQLGGIAVDDWSQIGIVAVLVLLGLTAALGLAATLNALALGEESAAYLGVQVERQKTLLIGVAALLTAAAVAIAGLVGFVGLVVPHALRLLLGPGHRLLLPASALGGALFLVVADLLARVIIAPAQLPLGVLTALAGGPFFLYLLRRSGQDYQW